MYERNIISIKRSSAYVRNGLYMLKVRAKKSTQENSFLKNFLLLLFFLHLYSKINFIFIFYKFSSWFIIQCEIIKSFLILQILKSSDEGILSDFSRFWKWIKIYLMATYLECQIEPATSRPQFIWSKNFLLCH